MKNLGSREITIWCKQKYDTNCYGYETNQDPILNLAIVQHVDMIVELPQSYKQQ